jgi:hypothetical protein
MSVSRRGWLVVAALALALPGCETGGHFSIAGYSTRPLHRTDVCTVRVPIFKNITYRDSTRQGLEMELTRAVVREIQQKTPYRVVGPNEDADTELTGTIVFLNKNVINRNQLNEVREGLTTLRVDVVWKDLRSGEFLSQPARPPGAPPPVGPDGEPLPCPPPTPMSVFSEARFIPELGESPTTAYKRNVDRLAQQIVHMMEAPW